jgi:hypothetical protein
VTSSESPWIDVKRSSPELGYQRDLSSVEQKFSWQAMFACQIGIRPFEERLKLKWGFSPAFLLEEALDRQKLFVESQLSNNPIDGQIEGRTLSLRCVCIPNKGLQLGLIAKVLAETQEQAHTVAQNYWRELASIFPYDYTIQPAIRVEEFQQLTGKELLNKCNGQNSIAQIRRFESPVRTTKGIFRILGLWHTEMRSDEQIWRALAGYQHELLLNITIRPTILYEGERRALLKMKQSAETPDNSQVNEPYLQHYEAWIASFIDRHTSPWNRYFYLQVHLASPVAIDEYIFRNIGSTITRENPDVPSPGYQVIYPLDKGNAAEWCKHLNYLDIIQTNNSFLLPRLSELASSEEAHAVFRLPFPPETGLPNTKFLRVGEG